MSAMRSARTALLLALVGAVAASSSCDGWCNEYTCSMTACVGCGVEKGCHAKPPPPPSPPPLPHNPPWYDGLPAGFIEFAATDGVLLANGQRFYIKGVNWCGSEGRAGPPLGLDVHNIAWYMKWLQSHGFNAIRFLFNHEHILSDPTLEPPNELLYGKGAPWEAPELAHFKYLEMFAKLAEVAAEHGILVMMACHRLRPHAWPGSGKWYDGTITEARVLESWDKIAERLCGQWNVFAVDLQNEPHSSSWGMGRGESSDWGHAAERLGNHVLTKCHRWLIFVEGVGYSPGAAGTDPNSGIFWGENLAGAKVQPVVLSNPSKLIYSPHTYGPAVYPQDYFGAKDFPRNMAAIWEDRFGFAQKRLRVPLVVGELGGTYTGADRQWQDAAVEYMRARGIGLFYFALNPQSDDTGGLLKDDMTTPEAAKLKLLSRLRTTAVLPLRTARRPPAPPGGLVSPPPPMASPPPPPPAVTQAPPSSSSSPHATRYEPPSGGYASAQSSRWKAEALAAAASPSPPPPPFPEWLQRATPHDDASVESGAPLPPSTALSIPNRIAAAIGFLALLVLGGLGLRSLVRKASAKGLVPADEEAETRPPERAPPEAASTRRIPRRDAASIFGGAEMAAPAASATTSEAAAGEARPNIDCWVGDDPHSLSVKELKRRIVALGAETQDCVEKADLVRRYEQYRRREPRKVAAARGV